MLELARVLWLSPLGGAAMARYLWRWREAVGLEGRRLLVEEARRLRAERDQAMEREPNPTPTPTLVLALALALALTLALALALTLTLNPSPNPSPQPNPKPAQATRRLPSCSRAC